MPRAVLQLAEREVVAAMLPAGRLELPAPAERAAQLVADQPVPETTG
jgi:hypothetical protein